MCSGLDRSRFSRVVGLVSHVFHYWGGGRLCLRLCGVLLWLFVGFALTAIGSFVWIGNGMEYRFWRGSACMENLFPCSFSRTNAFYDTFAPGTIGEMGLHPTKLEEMARSAQILRKTIAKHYVAAGTNDLSPQ